MSFLSTKQGILSIVSQRLFVAIFSLCALLLSAASCSFLPSFNSSSELTLGILKKDPSIRDTFGRVNTVKTLSGDENSDGLLKANVVEIIRESTDNVFALTEESGLFKTENGGRFWDRKYIFPVGSDNSDTEARDNEINTQIARNNTVKGVDIEISSSNPNLIFVTGTIDEVGKIWRSEDNGNSFQEVYSEIEKGNSVVNVAIDGRNNQIIYALLEGGVVLRSNDSGSSWRKVQDFRQSAVQLGVVPEFDNVLFALLQNDGYQYSLNGGQTWENIDLGHQDSNVGEAQNNDFTIRSNIFSKQDFGRFEKIIPVKTLRNSWVLLADRQIWYTDDLTQPFVKLVLPLTEEKYDVASVAVDPRRGIDRVLVSVDNNLFETNNRGQSWSTNDAIGLSSEIGDIRDIVIDEDNPNIVYIGLSET